jgi:hypothetical protein
VAGWLSAAGARAEDFSYFIESGFFLSPSEIDIGPELS